MNLQFANVWVLYFVWLVPALGVGWYFADRRRRDRLLAFVSIAMRQKLEPASPAARFRWQSGLLLAGLLGCVVAAARPQWGVREETVFERGRDVVIALDVSRSMLATDVHPNRLARAKADILDLIKELRGDRAALLAFRRKGVLLCPLTTDYAYVKEALDGTGVDSAPRGETDIGDAIAKALDAFESDEGAHKAIILISDGEDLSGHALQAAEEARKRNVPIFTVGLGSRSGATLSEEGHPGTPIQYRGSAVISKLDNDTLYGIAKTTGGAYIPVETASMTSTTLGTLYRDHLRNIQAQELQETEQRQRIDRFQWFLLPGVLLLLAGGSLSRGRLKVRSQKSEVRSQGTRGRTATPVALAVVSSLIVVAAGRAATNEAAGASTNPPAVSATAAAVPPGREGARMAQNLYLLGKYSESAETYIAAARGGGGEARRDFRFNAAVALYRAGRYQEAAGILKEITPSLSGRRTDVWEGLGGTLFMGAEAVTNQQAAGLAERARLLRESGEAFKSALRVKPDAEATRRNLGVTVQSWGAAQEQAKIAGLMERHRQTSPSRLAHEMLRSQRALNEEIPAALTNAAPSRIRQFEELGERESANADLWIPLKGKLMEAMASQPDNPTNRQIMATLNQAIEATRDNMQGASEKLRDLDPAGPEAAAAAEAGLYRMWTVIASYPEILQEDLWRQAKAMGSATNPSPPPESAGAQQKEAAGLTRMFSERFSKEVPEGGTLPAATNAAASPAGAAGGTATNAEDAAKGISAEDRKKILELAGRAAAAQDEATAFLDRKEVAAAVPVQKNAHELLKEIEKLLPKDKNKQQQQQQQQQQEQNKQQQEEEQEKQDKQKQEQPEPEQTQPQESQKPNEAPEQKEPETPQDVKRLLEKALQREREHEEELRQRNQNIPSSPIDRDW